MQTAAEGTAGTAPNHFHPVVVIAVLAFVGLLVAVLVTAALLSERGERRRLRRCPLCLADAVRAQRSDDVDAIRTRVDIQCGQCGTWRRVLTTRTELEDYSRRLAHDRGVMTAALALTAPERGRGSPLA